MDLAQLIFRYEQAHGAADMSETSARLQGDIVKDISDNSMSAVYASLCTKFGWAVDQTLASEMSERNITELDAINVKLDDAEKNAGDVEVLDFLFAKAKHHAKIGNCAEASALLDEVIGKKKCSTGKKIDATMEKAKMALFTMNTKELKEHVEEAKRLNDAGGDWDRRNRLKVYEAFYQLSVRNVKKASGLFMECVATFTCTELCSYKQFMFYALVTSVISLNRNELRKKVVNDAHVITVIRDLPSIKLLVTGVYNCDYAGVFKSILQVYPELMADRFLNPLSVYILREIRVLSYSQFLEAYKSVMLSSMAASFNVLMTFLDGELSRFIAAGRLTAKIDKVGDMIETSRSDKKNIQYQNIVKKGDLLLNRIQKLVRVIDV